MGNEDKAQISIPCNFRGKIGEALHILWGDEQPGNVTWYLIFLSLSHVSSLMAKGDRLTICRVTDLGNEYK